MRLTDFTDSSRQCSRIRSHRIPNSLKAKRMLGAIPNTRTSGMLGWKTVSRSISCGSDGDGNHYSGAHGWLALHRCIRRKYYLPTEAHGKPPNIALSVLFFRARACAAMSRAGSPCILEKFVSACLASAGTPIHFSWRLSWLRLHRPVIQGSHRPSSFLMFSIR